jgi:hypothetical protein
MINLSNLRYPVLVLLGPAVAVLLITYTTRTSHFRWMGLGFIAYISYFTFDSAIGFTSNHRDNGVLASVPFLQFCHTANLLFINAIDRKDLPAPKATTDDFAALPSSLALLFNFRGIGTQWLAKNVPTFPNYYLSQLPDRTSFYIRQLALVVWLYLLGDLITHLGTIPSADEQERLFGEGTEYLFFNATSEQWGARISSSLTTWFLLARVLMSCYYGIASLISITVGLSSPQDWPPAFNSISEAYTLRNFWGRVLPITDQSFTLTCGIGNIGINGYAGP